MEYIDLLYVILGITLVVVTYLWWVGFFTKMHLQKAVMKPKELLYRDYRGPYSKELGNVYQEINKLISRDKIASRCHKKAGSMCIGYFYDDPTQSEASQLRACCGFVFKPSSSEDRKYLIDEFAKYGYKYTNFGETKCIYSSFPVKFPMFVSYMIAPARFYTTCWKYFGEHPEIYKAFNDTSVSHCSVEVYTRDSIYFHVPLENYRDFDITPYPAPEPKEASKHK